jgi:tRNA dimethylallyltransferase
MSHESYIIAGPTASGKSDFAHALARRVEGVVINCDSVQIYSGIENISASPFAGEVGGRSEEVGVRSEELGVKSDEVGGRSEELGVKNEKLGVNNSIPPTSYLLTPNSYLLPPTSSYLDNVPYRLFSILPLTEQISVCQYLELARAEYNAAIQTGRPAVFVGGTGFYINALLNGISPIPEISDDARRRARAMVREYPDAARRLLQGSSPGFGALDPQRTARALEVFLETGRHLSEWQSLPRSGALFGDRAAEASGGRTRKILINPPRDILSRRIAARVPEMLRNGALAEARAATDAGWDANRAIGASEAAKFIRVEIGEREMTDNWITRTNKYAKRQRTWFRHQFLADIEIGRIPAEKDLELVLGK